MFRFQLPAPADLTAVAVLLATLTLLPGCASTPATGRAGNGGPADIAGEYSVAWTFRGQETPIRMVVEGSPDAYVVFWTPDGESPKRGDSVRFSRGTLTFIVPGTSPMSVRMTFRDDTFTGRWTTGEFGGPAISGAVRGRRDS